MPETVEPEDAGCEAVPADLVELHEVLEWQAAVEDLEAAESARGVTGSARDDLPESDDQADGDVSDTQTGQGIP